MNILAPDRRLQRKVADPIFIEDDLLLYEGDCLAVMSLFGDDSFDMIFADPPYMLSNGGVTCGTGEMVSVNKGKWDESKGFLNDYAFYEAWISSCKRILKPTGTIWISGTQHSIYKCGEILQRQGFHLLNDIIWYKPNAAPNLACTTFAHSHETLLWARKDKKARNTFNYTQMKEGNFSKDKLKSPGKQMRSVWSIISTQKREKTFGKHPTQKPLDLLNRIILASTKADDLILDPFNGSGTTGVACRSIGNRRYIGIEKEKEYIELTIKRLR